MRFILILIIGSLLSIESEAQQQSFLIENFESEKIGGLPVNWYNQRGEKKPSEFGPELRSTYEYEVMEENGNKFLRYDGKKGKHMSFPLLNKEAVNINETPILSWKWRIHDTPDGANEDSDDKNDAAASIYVAFDMGRVALFKKVPKSIRYTWSSSLPAGTELSKFFGNQKIIVIGTGESEAGKWMTFERNIVEDYKRLFKDNPPSKPLALLILSDGDSTNKRSKADYDDIILKSETNK